jgi:hypothetical protein
VQTTIKAIIDTTNGVRLQVSFGEETEAPIAGAWVSLTSNGRKPDHLLWEADRAFFLFTLAKLFSRLSGRMGSPSLSFLLAKKPGAGERNRTFTALRSPDFESGASASSATPANKNLDVISAPRVTRRPSFFLRDRRRAQPADLRMLDTIRAGVHRLGEGPTSR